MKSYLEVMGIFAHIVLVILIVCIAVEQLTNLEVGRHEYHMTSIYSSRSDPELKQAITDAMSDGKISWREYWYIEDVEKSGEDRKYMADLLKNTGH